MDRERVLIDTSILAILRDWLQRRAVGAVKTVSLDELEQELAADGLDELRRSDADLWSAARSTLPAEQRQQLEALHDKQQRVGLTTDEQTQEQTLRTLYRETLLMRAQAVALLQQRGYDVSDPTAFHPPRALVISARDMDDKERKTYGRK